MDGGLCCLLRRYGGDSRGRAADHAAEHAYDRAYDRADDHASQTFGASIDKG